METLDREYEAQRMRSGGMSYANIALFLGVSATAVNRWCNPGYQDRCTARNREPKARQRANEQAKARYTDTLYGRCKCALASSRSAAKKRGHTPCTADVETLMAAWTGKCHLCGVPEEECSTRFHMDHDHATGEFRGWLCYRHNVGLAAVLDDPSLILLITQYLNTEVTSCVD